MCIRDSNLIDRKICKDNKEDIVLILREWINKNTIDVVITTGGTGLTGRDITPEAIDEIADKQIPGFGEVFRNISLKTVGTSAIQSSLCSISKWQICFCITRFLWRRNRCMGWNFKTSIRYQS